MPKLLSDAELVAELNSLGCAMTEELLNSLIVAVATVPHQGTEERHAELCPHTGDLITAYQTDDKGRPIKGADGQPIVLHRDKPYDEEHVELQRCLLSSLLRKINHSHGPNKLAKF